MKHGERLGHLSVGVFRHQESALPVIGARRFGTLAHQVAQRDMRKCLSYLG